MSEQVKKKIRWHIFALLVLITIVLPIIIHITSDTFYNIFNKITINISDYKKWLKPGMMIVVSIPALPLAITYILFIYKFLREKISISSLAWKSIFTGFILICIELFLLYSIYNIREIRDQEILDWIIACQAGGLAIGTVITYSMRNSLYKDNIIETNSEPPGETISESANDKNE